jgi:hypothetical protein
VVKSIINQKPFWNDEHRVQPTVSGETVDRSPFFDFDTDLYDQKKKFQYLNTSVRSKNSILLIYLPNN